MAGRGPSAGAGGRRRLCLRRQLVGDDVEGRPGLGAPLGRYVASRGSDLGKGMVERRRHGELLSPALMVGDGGVLCAGKQGLGSGSARVERGRGEALVHDANEGGQSSTVRPGEVEDAALG